MSDLETKVTAYLKSLKTPPSDDEFHKWCEDNSLVVHEAEAAMYKIAHKSVAKESFHKLLSGSSVRSVLITESSDKYYIDGYNFGGKTTHFGPLSDKDAKYVSTRQIMHKVIPGKKIHAVNIKYGDKVDSKKFYIKSWIEIGQGETLVLSEWGPFDSEDEANKFMKNNPEFVTFEVAKE